MSKTRTLLEQLEQGGFPDAAERIEELETEKELWEEGFRAWQTHRDALEAENARLREKLQAYRDADDRRLAVEAHVAMNKARGAFEGTPTDLRRRAEEAVEWLSSLAPQHFDLTTSIPRNKATAAADLIRELAGLEEKKSLRADTPEAKKIWDTVERVAEHAPKWVREKSDVCPIEQKAREAWRRLPVEALMIDGYPLHGQEAAFIAGYRAAAEERPAIEDQINAQRAVWKRTKGRLEAERDEALKRMDRLGKMCADLNDSNHEALEALQRVLAAIPWQIYARRDLPDAMIEAKRVLSARGLEEKAAVTYGQADDGLLHDAPHKTVGRGRPARTLRNQRGRNA